MPINNHYNFIEIERKWQQRWREARLFHAEPDPARPKFYGLEFFPYPSGAGLSVGHFKNYAPTDAFLRYKAMRGYNVLHPMGWDAFGQPAENEAIKRGRNPREMVPEYAANYRRQLDLIGLSYDWDREINSSDPAYYRWTQWIFLLLYRMGLAYRAEAPVNWCPRDRTVLANEEVVGGRCWRCDTPIERRLLPQWFFRITAYADRLLNDLDTVDWPEGIKAMQRNWIGRSEENGVVSYKLRDWLISRQRYWGAPIPIIHCAHCGEAPVPEDQLPVLLPAVDQYQPSGTGESPLATLPDFVETTCPVCGSPAYRETDTMGGFACSSWYFLRFADPHNAERAFSREAVDYWLPVDMYVGGAEHAVMHLLYARFWTKALYDAGLISFTEPFTRLRNQGMMLAFTAGRSVEAEEEEASYENWKVLRPEERDTIPEEQWIWRWVKMSKSYGNVVTPDEAAERYGADALRVYELFVAPFEETVQWSEEGIRGSAKFLSRVWRLVAQHAEGFSTERWQQNVAGALGLELELRRKTHHTIAKVTDDMETFRFNTAVAALMEWVNAMYEVSHALPAGTRSAALDEAIEMLIQLLAPAAPHIADELWEGIGKEGFLYRHPWPSPDPTVAGAAEITLIVQYNGKLRDKLTVPADADPETLQALALASPKIQESLGGRQPKKTIVVPGKVVNVVA
ncbi:MAG: class I tRNA ligase family protein [Armatimonadota bacterium]